MGKEKNVFISHYNKDDEHIQKLKDRLKEKGYTIKNSSIDSTKPNRVISKPAIERLLRMRINWAGTFICLIGPDTHSRPWVNWEIKQAHDKGKRIIGVYVHGAKQGSELPANLVKYGGPVLGWNSVDKIIDALEGKNFDWENSDGSTSTPRNALERVNC